MGSVLQLLWVRAWTNVKRIKKRVPANFTPLSSYKNRTLLVAWHWCPFWLISENAISSPRHILMASFLCLKRLKLSVVPHLLGQRTSLNKYQIQLFVNSDAFTLICCIRSLLVGLFFYIKYTDFRMSLSFSFSGLKLLYEGLGKFRM